MNMLGHLLPLVCLCENLNTAVGVISIILAFFVGSIIGSGPTIPGSSYRPLLLLIVFVHVRVVMLY